MRERFIGAVTLLALASLALVACGGTAKPPSAAQPALDLRVIAEREIEVDSGRILSLSPDGQWLVVDDQPDLCIYATESMDEEVCVTYRDPDLLRSLAQSTLAWSPDSTRLAFCENSTRFMHESDLWLLEIETGELRNLTDDEYHGDILGPGRQADEFQLDFAPAWSPDGKALVFARSEVTEDGYQGTDLYIIDADGGEPQRLVRVTREEPLVVWYRPYWAARPERVFYSVTYRDPEERDSGLWVVDRGGREDEQILEVNDPEKGSPLLMGVSETVQLGLIWYPRAAGVLAVQPNVSHYALVDLDTGRVEPLKEASGDEIEFILVGNATLSPDGSKVAYVYRDLEMTNYLVVRDLSGGEENILFETDEFALGGRIDFGLGLDWALDDTIYVWTDFQSGLLLKVGAK
jgi:Tol biopolymer transport system component